MNRLIRWYNKNRKFFWIVIAIAVGIVLLIQLLNNYSKNYGNKEKKKETIYVNKNYSVISDEVVNEKIVTSNVNIITKFIDYCNNKNINAAYNLLSNDCKEKIFPSIKEFEEYVNNVFSEKKLYKYQAWISKDGRHTYRIELSEDILATGNSSTSKLECYYTVIKENGQTKLNIKNYVGSEIINKSASKYDIKITAVKKDIYIDYEIYTFNVENKTSRKIKLDSGEYLESMYLKDSSNISRICKRDEVDEESLVVLDNKKNIQIKYENAYSPNLNIRKIVFNDLILNYYKYLGTEDKKQYNLRGVIEIGV